MSHGAAASLLVAVCLWTVVKGAERSVTCRLSESCILPCPFKPGPEVVIHWLHPPDDSTHSVHSFYHNEDQLERQNPRYKGRTQLFNDHIAQGNASLLLTGIQVEDGGRYKCYTSTTQGNNEDFITVNVEAPVRAVSLSEDGQQLLCSSEGVYPKPSVSWSPPSSAARTTLTPSEGGVWSVHSSVPLPHSPPHQYSCNVSDSRGRWRSATYRRPDPVALSGSEITVSCLDSRSPVKTLLWTFNRTQTVLNQTGSVPVYGLDWASRATLGSGSDLVLRDLNQDHQGLYSCLLTTDEQTYLTVTEVNVNEAQKPGDTQVLVPVLVPVLVVVVVVVVVAISGFFLYKFCKRRRDSPAVECSPEETMTLETKNGDVKETSDR